MHNKNKIYPIDQNTNFLGGKELEKLVICIVVCVLFSCAQNLSRYEYSTRANVMREAGFLRLDYNPEDAIYSKEYLIESFRNIAFEYEFMIEKGGIKYQSLEHPLMRWDNVIRYQIIGDALMKEDADNIVSIAEGLQSISGVRWMRVQHNANFLISVSTDRGSVQILDELEDYGFHFSQDQYLTWMATPNWACGVTLATPSPTSYRISHAHIFVHASLNARDRLGCFHEEMSQAMGLTNDADRRPSVFNDDQEFSNLTKHDCQLLDILYDPRLELGLEFKDMHDQLKLVAQDVYENSKCNKLKSFVEVSYNRNM